MGTAGRIAIALAGAALLAALFFAFRPDGEDADADVTAVTTVAAEPAETQPAETASTPVETETEAAAPPPTEPQGPTTVRVRVEDGNVVGGIQHVTVRQGERVRLVVRADVADHVHLHGYDVMRDVAPGAPAQLVFEATIPGRFEVELEDRRLPIAEIEVRP